MWPPLGSWHWVLCMSVLVIVTGLCQLFLALCSLTAVQTFPSRGPRFLVNERPERTRSGWASLQLSPDTSTPAGSFLVSSREVVPPSSHCPAGKESTCNAGDPSPIPGSGRSHTSILGLPLWLSWSRICLQCGRPGFHPRVGKIPWRRERPPTPVFWPGEFHGL